MASEAMRFCWGITTKPVLDYGMYVVVRSSSEDDGYRLKGREQITNNDCLLNGNMINAAIQGYCFRIDTL